VSEPLTDLTVIVCTHNRPQWLERCLRSIVEQDHGAWNVDVLVVDDASDVRYAKRLAEGFAQVRVVRTEQNLRQYRVMDFALSQPLGRHVAFLGDDDALMPGANARRLEMLRHHPGAVMAIGGHVDVRLRSADDDPVQAWQRERRPFPRDEAISGEEFLRRLICGDRTFTWNGVMFRTDALVKTLPFRSPVSIKVGRALPEQDIDTILRACAWSLNRADPHAGGVVVTNAPVVWRTFHAGNWFIAHQPRAVGSGLVNNHRRAVVEDWYAMRREVLEWLEKSLGGDWSAQRTARWMRSARWRRVRTCVWMALMEARRGKWKAAAATLAEIGVRE